MTSRRKEEGKECLMGDRDFGVSEKWMCDRIGVKNRDSARLIDIILRIIETIEDR